MDTEASEDYLDPATPDLFGYSYHSDTSSVDGPLTDCSQSSKKKKRGRPSMYLTGEPVECWLDIEKNMEYKIGDFVLFDDRKSADDFRIGMVLAIRKTKKQRFMLSVRLYFKASQLPEGVYQRLMEDRNGENLGGFADFLSANPVIREREVFKSEKSEVIRAISIRGRCTVIQLTDVKSAKKFIPVVDTYFTLLGYNPDTRRLATIQGEIRIGSSHQAKLPECKAQVLPSARSGRVAPEGIGGGDNGEEQLWSPNKIHSDELDEYIKATISMVASFTNLSERKPVDESVNTARRDENKQLALNHLHRSGYDKNRAVAEFVTSVPLVRSVDRRWDEEDSKKFMKGLRVFGKNFFKIRKEFLPEKETRELIEYYYYWKKTPVSNIPNRTGRRPKSRKGGSSASKAPSSAGENSSESEEVDGETYTCFRCDTESSNQWHYVDQHGFVCESCKLNYRKYGDENGEKIPEYLFRPVEPALSYQRPVPKKKPKGEDGAEGEEGLPDAAPEDRQSPGASSTSSNASSSRTPRKRKSKSPGKAKRSIMAPSTTANKPIETEADSTQHDPALGEATEKKKKMEQSSPDSLASELHGDTRNDDGEDAGNMGDVEQDDNSTTSPRSNAGSEDSLDQEGPVQPDTSEPVPCSELFHQREHAHFVRCWWREGNSCCRVDVHYVPPPGSEMSKRREERLKKPAPPSAQVPHSQSHDVVKIKTEPAHSIGSDVIRHTSQSQHSMRVAVPPSSMQSPHQLSRDSHRMTPTQQAHAAHAAAMASAHHQSLGHGGHPPPNHRVATPSQRVTPRSQQPTAEQLIGSNTPALLQLSQLAAGRQQQQLGPQSLDEMARFAAYHAAATNQGGAAAGMDGAALQLQQLHYYRMIRSVMPPEQVDRMYPMEIRERFDMALKAQEMESQHKLLLAQAGHSGGVSMDSKAMFEAHMMEMQRKLGLPPGGMLPPGSMQNLPMGLMQPGSMSGGNPVEMMARERDKMAMLGLFGGTSPLADPMVAMAQPPTSASPADRLSAERLTAEQRLAAGLTAAANTAHAHTHTHTHLHLHQAEQAAQAAAAAAAMASQNPYLAQQLMQSLSASPEQQAYVRAAAAAGSMPYGMPPGFPMPGSGAEMPAQMMAAFAAAQQGAGQEMSQREREILALHQIQSNNISSTLRNSTELYLQQQRERERQMSRHMPPH